MTRAKGRWEKGQVMARGYIDERRVRDDDDNEVSFDDAQATGETEAALCVELSTRKGPLEVWFPKSQITDDSEVYALGHRGKLVVTRWIAEQKDLA